MEDFSNKGEFGARYVQRGFPGFPIPSASALDHWRDLADSNRKAVMVPVCFSRSTCGLTMRKDVKRSLFTWPLAASMLTVLFSWIGFQTDLFSRVIVGSSDEIVRPSQTQHNGQADNAFTDDHLADIAVWPDVSFELSQPSVPGLPTSIEQTAIKTAFSSQSEQHVIDQASVSGKAAAAARSGP